MSRGLQIFAGVLLGDERARAIGCADGLAGRDWAPPKGIDGFAYSLGFHDGEMERAARDKRADVPERSQ